MPMDWRSLVDDRWGTKGFTGPMVDAVNEARDGLFGRPARLDAANQMMQDAIFGSNANRIGHRRAAEIARVQWFRDQMDADGWVAEHVLHMPPGSPAWRMHMAEAGHDVDRYRHAVNWGATREEQVHGRWIPELNRRVYPSERDWGLYGGPSYRR